MALWCYLLPNWNINNLKINPNLTGAELQRARAILAAAKDIYVRGTAWNKIYSPRVTAVPDRDTAYAVTVDGQQYKQQVFTIHSDTWVCNYAIRVAFSDPASIPAGARIVDMNNKDITTITTSGTGDGYGGKFKVLYPAAAVAGKTGSVQLSFTTDVYKYAVFYAVCAEQNKYGKLQNYMCDTDPTVTMRLSAYSNYSDSGEVEEPDTGLKIVKLEKGTDTPLSGAVFEVVDPDGATVGTFATGSDGTVTIPLTLAGNYTVYERVAPLNHLLSDTPAQNIKVEYGKVAEITFWNEPYGTLRIEKLSDTGAHLPGAMVQIKHIESGTIYTAETNFAGYAIFDNIKPGAYEIREITSPSGWLKDDATYTATVATGETTTFTLVNKELPGLRIIKYDRKNMVAMANVTFEIFRDGVSLGKYRTDEFGEILITDAAPGTYRAVEVDTGSDGHILDTTPQEAELSAGDGIKELLFFNDVKPGLRLVKVDSTDPSKVIPNAVFEIKSVAGDYGPKEFTTDQSGEIDLSKLPTGAYVVTEKSCEGYIIDQAQRILATCRSYNIGLNIIVQNIQQIKALYEKEWESIIGNCDTLLFLGGGNEPTSLEFIVKLLGKETIATRTRGETKGRSGSSSTNFQQTGRDLMTIDEVRKLDTYKAILFIRGEDPVIDRKYNLKRHPNIKLTSDGKAKPYMGYYDSGLALTTVTTSLAWKPVLFGGTPEQKRLFCDLVLNGSGCASFALTEPGGGSDVASTRTKAVHEGDEYVINGAKCFITNGGGSSVFIAVASTSPELGSKGLTAFLVERDRPGITIGKEEDKCGIRTSNTVEVVFDNVRVPVNHRLGEEGDGFKLVMKTLDLSRPYIAAIATGMAQRALDEAVKYSKERVTFGKPICKFQSLQFMMADMAMLVETSRQMYLHAIDLAERKLPFTKEAAISKAYATECATKVAENAIQIMGGYGYMREYPVERIWRDSKIYQIFEGTNQVQRVVIAGQVLNAK